MQIIEFFLTEDRSVQFFEVFSDFDYFYGWFGPYDYLVDEADVEHF